eukprot:2774674-Rhodomonas_salina.1
MAASSASVFVAMPPTLSYLVLALGWEVLLVSSRGGRVMMPAPASCALSRLILLLSVQTCVPGL